MLQRQSAQRAAPANGGLAALRPARTEPDRAALHPILQLQQSIGNQAVARLLAAGRLQPMLRIGQPGDRYEREADRVADEVVRSPGPVATTPSNGSSQLQRKCAACAGGQELCPNCADEEKIQRKPLAETITPLVQRQTEEPEEEEEEALQAKPLPGQSPQAAAGVESQLGSLRGGGQPLPDSVRAFFEPRFGADFSHVRVHTGAQAAESAEAVNARAFTLNSDVVFGADEFAPTTSAGQKLLAHELAHVVQQSRNNVDTQGIVSHRGDRYEPEVDQVGRPSSSQRDHPDTGGESARVLEDVTGVLASEPTQAIRQKVSWPRVQCYEAGEHAEFGETSKEMKGILSERAFSYVVKAGETPERIASNFNVSVEELKKLNTTKLRTWRATSGKRIRGFNAGEKILIPPRINASITDALKSNELIFVVNGVKLEYGVGISMGDFFESPSQMLSTPKAKLEALAALIRKEKSGTSVSTEEWNAATDGRYTKLAEKNEAHFAPSDPKLVVASKASSANHKTEWERHHKIALWKSQMGKKDEALQVNAFGDHFLTDAFAGGHLINKRDVMEKFKSSLVDSKGKFTKHAVSFFDAVAKHSFIGSVKTEFSKYETVEWKGGVFRPNINSADRFSQLLQGIHEKEPDVLANAVAKAVHDSLNRMPKGIPVMNAKGDKWNLSGDKTLNPQSKEIGRKAVAQSQLNILGVFGSTAKLALKKLFKRVWDYVPRPTRLGVAKTKEKVASGTDPKERDLQTAVVSLIKGNYDLILRELVDRKILKKA